MWPLRANRSCLAHPTAAEPRRRAITKSPSVYQFCFRADHVAGELRAIRTQRGGRRLRHAIHFRCAAPPTSNPDKYADELLDAYLYVEDADILYAEYAANGVEFSRELGNTPWQSREFVMK